MRKRRSRLSLWAVWLLAAAFLAGCWDSNEPERMVYLHGIGIDYKDGEYTIYMQIINPGLLAKSEASNNTVTNVEVGRATGKTVVEAMFNLYASSQRRIFWGHLAFVVLTEEALNSDRLKSAIDFIDRYQETRYRVYLFATDEPLPPLLTNIPIMEMSTALSRLSDPQSTYKQSSLVRPVDLREMIILLNEPPHEARLPLVRVTRRWRTDEAQHQSIETRGVALVTKDHLKGFIKGDRTNGLKWLNPDLKREELRLTEKGYRDISLIIDKLKVEVTPVGTANDLRFTISVQADAILRSLQQDVSGPTIAKKAEETMEKQIKSVYLDGLEHNTDIFRLSESLYRENVKLWKKLEQDGKIPLTEDSLKNVSVKVDVIHAAKQRNIPTIE
ncbi:Ger(x)C family spore germination protein [Bacillus xiapuensis]|uniref:Ger(x)C family spore germination protein n=1 Tax=Bacillus xiapuensis TaxID=2014075 RepID=UPI000C2357A4|nr:Ger(x)C family spore germination protein [Bacillus xiapuensis]